jgi:hypothetical protein
MIQLRESRRSQLNFEANVSKFLNKDQLAVLKSSSRRTGRITDWSSETVQQALTIRTVVGRNGYNHLRQLNYPLPSYRTLCRRLESAPFAPGIQHDVLQWLQHKMAGKKAFEKECVLLVDEMQLKERLEFDQGLKRFVGYISPETLSVSDIPENCNALACHVIVFMVRGMASSWKQTVAYLFTGMTFPKDRYWLFTKTVIAAVESSGLKVSAVTSDMGPINVGLWNEIGIKSMKTVTVPFVSHPCTSERRLYFLADPPHLLKNLWNCLLTHTLELDDDVVKKHSLPSRVVDAKYVRSLVDLQTGHSLRLAYKLNKSHISPTQYEKMRVSLAAQFLSRSTAAALEVCVRKELLPVDALTTAWFLKFVNDWFDAMNARHKQAGLFRTKIGKPSVLAEMLIVIQGLSFSGKKIWKPIQSGIKLSTTATLRLSKEMMLKHNLQYFLPGRLSQDPVENLFSQVRGRGVSHPSCVMFRQTLRLISVAQFLAVPKSSAYDADGCKYLVNYLKDHKRRIDNDDDGTTDENTTLYDVDITNKADDMLPEAAGNSCTTENELLSLVPIKCQSSSDHLECSGDLQLASHDIEMAGEESVVSVSSAISVKTPQPVISPTRRAVTRTLSELEKTAQYDAVGWAVAKAIQHVNCDACRAAFVTSDVENVSHSFYTTARSYGGLTHPTNELLDAMKLVESTFQHNRASFSCLDNIDEDIVKQAVDVL